MNRSILIVICDFLLISMLAFSNVDSNKVPEQNADRRATVASATNQVEARQDLGNVMRLALDEERKTRDALMGELAKTRGTLEQQQALISQHEQQTHALQQQIQTREQAAAELAREREGLARELAGAQTNLAVLNEQLHANTVQTVLTKEGLAATEAEAKKQADQAAALKQQLAQLEKSNQVVQVEKQQLATQLQVAQAEQHAATEIAANMRDQVKIEREEKARLAEGVKALADGVKAQAVQSGALAKEIHESRPLAANTIFNELVTNRVAATFHTYRSALLGIDGKRDRETETVLVTDGTNTFALCHVEDTPLTLSSIGTDWQTLTGSLSHGATLLPIHLLSFSAVDPRVVLIRVTDTEARELNSKVYHVSGDPFKFENAVVIGAREGYYGESKFQIDLSTPSYVKMDHNSLKGLFGKFNPTHGDLVFSKNGDLLGIMANNTYCLVLGNFTTTSMIQFGEDIRSEHTGMTLSELYGRIMSMPFKLQ